MTNYNSSSATYTWCYIFSSSDLNWETSLPLFPEQILLWWKKKTETKHYFLFNENRKSKEAVYEKITSWRWLRCCPSWRREREAHFGRLLGEAPILKCSVRKLTIIISLRSIYKAREEEEAGNSNGNFLPLFSFTSGTASILISRNKLMRIYFIGSNFEGPQGAADGTSGLICLRMKAWHTPLRHTDLPQQLPIRQNLDVYSVNKLFVFVPSLRLWFLISFIIIMHPSWIGLLLAAVRSSSGQLPKSVAFGAWFLSLPDNYTLSWLMSWSVPPPRSAEAALFLFCVFSQRTRGEGRVAGAVSPKNCSSRSSSARSWAPSTGPSSHLESSPHWVMPMREPETRGENGCYFPNAHRPHNGPMPPMHRTTSVKHVP